MDREQAEPAMRQLPGLKVRTLVRVAIEDVGWLVVLVPLAVLFQLLLILARGTYACRRSLRQQHGPTPVNGQENDGR